jgi:hypothetical protein
MPRRAPHAPETIARIRAAQHAHWANPEARAQQATLTRRRMARPGVSEKISERTKAALAEPETRARHQAAMALPAVRQHISERTREAMRDPTVRQRIRDGMARAARMRAELEPLWAIWASLSDEARCLALRAIVRPPAP